MYVYKHRETWINCYRTQNKTIIILISRRELVGTLFWVVIKYLQNVKKSFTLGSGYLSLDNREWRLLVKDASRREKGDWGIRKYRDILCGRWFEKREGNWLMEWNTMNQRDNQLSEDCGVTGDKQVKMACGEK